MNKRFATFGVLVASGMAVVGQVHAAVPEAITQAISTMQADGVTVATSFVVAAIAVAAIKFLRSAK